MRTMHSDEPTQMRHVRDVCHTEHPWAIQIEHPRHRACAYARADLAHAHCSYPEVYICDTCVEDECEDCHAHGHLPR